MTDLARFARPLLYTVAIAALLLASGCGQEDKQLEGKEGARVDLDGIVYQVQLSRILNPEDVEDAAYLVDQPAPASDEAYYAVFIRVDNEEGGKAIDTIPLESFTLRDASGKEYEPIAVDAPGLTYEQTGLREGDRLPAADTAADNYPNKGALILFKVPYSSLEDRPLELELHGADGDHAEITLDV